MLLTIVLQMVACNNSKLPTPGDANNSLIDKDGNLSEAAAALEQLYTSIPRAIEGSFTSVAEESESELLLRCWVNYNYEGAEPPKRVMARTFWKRLNTDLKEFFQVDSPFKISQGLADRVGTEYFPNFSYGAAQEGASATCYFTGITARQRNISSAKPPIGESGPYNLFVYWCFFTEMFVKNGGGGQVTQIQPIIDLFVDAFPKHGNYLRENLDPKKAERFLRDQPFTFQPGNGSGFFIKKN